MTARDETRGAALDDACGPYYSSDAAARMLGVAVDALASLEGLLEVRSTDDARLYPAFQFHGGRLHQVMAEAVTILASATTDPWDVARWLCAPQFAFLDLSACQWLDADGDPDVVLIFAEVIAKMWSHR